MTQIALLLGRPLRMPADEDGNYDDEVDVYLSPRQATWIGLDAPTVPQCPGCVLFGCCARHNENAKPPGSYPRRPR